VGGDDCGAQALPLAKVLGNKIPIALDFIAVTAKDQVGSRFNIGFLQCRLITQVTFVYIANIEISHECNAPVSMLNEVLHRCAHPAAIVRQHLWAREIGHSSPNQYERYLSLASSWTPSGLVMFSTAIQPST